MNAWHLWQILDSAFPTGSFGHSLGLEAAVAARLVTDPASLDDFLRASMHQAAYGTVPVAAAIVRDPPRFPDADALCDRMILQPLARRSSLALGRGLFGAFARVRPAPSHDGPPGDPFDRHRTYDGPRHYPAVFGLVMASLSADPRTTADAVLFCQARSVLAASVRLGIIGPLQAQKLQHDATDLAHTLAQTTHTLGLDDAAQTAPLLEIVAGGHDRLYSRMFLT